MKQIMKEEMKSLLPPIFSSIGIDGDCVVVNGKKITVEEGYALHEALSDELKKLSGMILEAQHSPKLAAHKLRKNKAGK